MNLTEMPTMVMQQAVLTSWLESYFESGLHPISMNRSHYDPEEYDLLMSGYVNMLIAFAFFIGAPLDRGTLVTAMLMEWGLIATRSDSDSDSGVDCNSSPRNHDEGNKSSVVVISGMEFYIDPEPLWQKPCTNREFIDALTGLE